MSNIHQHEEILYDFKCVKTCSICTKVLVTLLLSSLYCSLGREIPQAARRAQTPGIHIQSPPKDRLARHRTAGMMLVLGAAALMILFPRRQKNLLIKSQSHQVGRLLCQLARITAITMTRTRISPVVEGML